MGRPLTRLPFIQFYVYLQLERYDLSASQTLRSAFTKAEAAYAGLTYDLVVGIIRHAELNVDMNESILRLQGSALDADGKCQTTKLIIIKMPFFLFSSC